MKSLLRYRTPLATALAIIAASLILQACSGVYRAEFSSFSDETAHYVTALMIRDYAYSGFQETPLAFARAYYDHYPKVAFGAWPPFFHVASAVWMSVFSTSRQSILFFMALIAGLWSASLYWAAEKPLGKSIAGLASALLLLLPLVQDLTSSIMADNLIGLFDFWAMLAFGSFLDRGRTRDVTLFTVFATLNCLTKPNGVALLLLPFFAVILANRLELLTDWRFWAPFPVIVFLSGPSEYISWRFTNQSVEKTKLSPVTVVDQLAGNFRELFLILGVALSVLLVLGLLRRFSRKGADPEQGLWISAASLLLAVIVFHSLIPQVRGVQDRYLTGALGPSMLFAGAGMRAVWDRIGQFRSRSLWKIAVVGALVVVLWLSPGLRIPDRHPLGFQEIAARLSLPENRNSVVLVSSEAFGEGLTVAELAMADKRPEHKILRASKVLSESNWNGQDYHLKFTTPESVLTFLDDESVKFVVLDSTPGLLRQPHHALLIEAIESAPERWGLLGVFPQNRKSERPLPVIRVYQRAQSPTSAAPPPQPRSL
jgi:hypothetical protein